MDARETDTQNGQNAAPGAAAPLPGTPALDGLLARVSSRLSRYVWLHGLGSALFVAAAWLAFCFLADWWLHLPSFVRVMHLAALVAFTGWVAWRELARPLARRPGRDGLALLVERGHPGLAELLVSAVQLRARGGGDGDPELVARVLREAEARSAELSPARALDPRGPRRRALIGALAVAACVALFVHQAEAARVFFARIAGGSTPWPQRTQLALEVPLTLGGFDQNADDAAAGAARVVRVARGSDVPVLVRADGLVPEEVVLHLSGSRAIVLGSSGDALFRTVLRAVHEDVELHATGGDDQDDEPRVRLVVLDPPDVAGIAVRVRPPAYSGIAESLERRGDVEALAGSQLTFHVRTDPSRVRARARLLPEDRVLELASAPFPPEAETAEPLEGRSFTLQAERSLRYRFELEDEQGLANPDPGLYALTVVEDRAPEVELTAPGRGDFDTVAGGLVPLRARAQDDFGLASLAWEIVPQGAEPGALPPVALEWRALGPEERAGEGENARGAGAAPTARAPRVVGVAQTRLEVAQLLAGAPLVEGQQAALTVRALDNAEPAAHEGRSAAVRIRVVSTEEFLRRIQERLARAQASTSALADLQRAKRRTALDLLATLASDAPGAEGLRAEVAAAALGQRRVQGDARALARELVGAAESVLHARLDDDASGLLDRLERAALERATREPAARGLDPEPWREVARSLSSDPGAGGLSSKLVEIAARALSIGEESTGEAAAALARAADAPDLVALRGHVETAERAQARAEEALEDLMRRLAEWENFQSVLGLARDILNGQRSLSERTRAAAREK